MLLGGSGQDNLFNHPSGLQPGDALEAHLDLLVSVGGNYVRNTMSTRDPGNVFPFYRDPDTGLFDLDRFHDAYWKRLDAFLALARDRDIIVQIELWDPHDYYYALLFVERVRSNRSSLAILAWGDARISETARNLLLDAKVSSNIESFDRGLRGGPDHMLFDRQQGAFATSSQWHEYGVGFQAELGIVGEENPVWWMAEWPEPVQINLVALSGTYDNQPQPTTAWKTGSPASAACWTRAKFRWNSRERIFMPDNLSDSYFARCPGHAERCDRPLDDRNRCA